MKEWRTLIRVMKLVIPSHIVVFIPAWSVDVDVNIDWDVLPESIQDQLAGNFTGEPMYLHAKVNLGVEHMNKLTYMEWEHE